MYISNYGRVTVAMMVITRILNRTVGEDNKKTEMWNSSPLFTLLLADRVQVHDGESNGTHWFDIFCRRIGEYLSLSD